MPRLPSLLEQTLSALTRRYRLPELDVDSADRQKLSPDTAVAIAIERVRVATAARAALNATLNHDFCESLARLIEAVVHPQTGEAVYQAAILRYREATVREYAALSSHAERDRRLIHAAFNTIAHPARLQRMAAGTLREALTRLYASAMSSSWIEFEDGARRLLEASASDGEAPVRQRIQRLLDSEPLTRLQRLQALEADQLVRRYRSLWEQQGPVSGSAAAAEQGIASKQRGDEIEALAAGALRALAERLEREDPPMTYRVVTSLRVPASLPSSHEHAKTEWDVVLLQHAAAADETSVWDIALLLEAKASVHAASTDFPRLLRGLRLLAAADESTVYVFPTRESAVRISGASLSALSSETNRLADAVLYCCDASADAAPRLLNAANRMHLLLAPASLAYASTMMEAGRPDAATLEPVWRDLLESPRWSIVLDQYPMLQQVRELTVHIDDLLAAIKTS
ncbi:3-deoxy-D-arabino-heptulosonate 7-phosphate synthase [Caballeronia sp. Lep1P3]|uniref:3-deoxy-D-arabino-heptulosonate 7-phosphate synthase n=1 Tax=Caballeronia sp. Lep1P3 TaxID=2878150 RepID=UPI001FD315F8|nr:3-deoxy-D-arabino-heptulosonate 7-phosphate synthase [Caballeronia sp. Lep1P3]